MRLDRVTRHLDPPFVVIDAQALRANAAGMLDRARGRPLRIASKSVRCRAVLADVAAMPGVRGVMAYALAEAVWLARAGFDDVLVGYPSVDRSALRELASDPEVATRVTIMIDDLAHLDLLDEATGPGERVEVAVCIDVDASLRLSLPRVGSLHLGVRRSPLRTPEDVAVLASQVARRPGFRLAGVMFYEAQVAGLPDTSAAVRWMKARSLADLLRRRRAVVEAVGAASGVGDLLVNGGGTGSLAQTAADPVITEVTAGSGLYCPALFDGYRAFRPRPAAWFVLPVVRRPTPRVATTFAGGYVASGPAGRSRLPRPVWPVGLALLRGEGAGEVQTPVRGAAATSLRIGDRIWLRHAKAGELLERFDVVHVVDGARVEAVATYRGEGRCFG
jgi:D-serine deaminase-like pyridoxal phosphate-dependent protein